jgi:biotin transport system substrate-specific component
MMDTVLLKVGVRRNLAVDLALIIGFSWIIALSARISFLIPGTAVPISGQTFAVLLAGALLGSRLGSMSIMAYLAQGAIGLPVFALTATMGYGGGVARFTGPTGGFLIGFIAAAFVVGLLVERGFGLPWLARFFAPAWLTGWQLDFKYLDPTGGLLMAGLYPFIPGDLIKLILAAVALPSGWALISRMKN